MKSRTVKNMKLGIKFKNVFCVLKALDPQRINLNASKAILATVPITKLHHTVLAKFAKITIVTLWFNYNLWINLFTVFPI